MKFIIKLLLFGVFSASGFSQSYTTTQLLYDFTREIQVPAGKLLDVAYYSSSTGSNVHYYPEGSVNGNNLTTYLPAKIVGPGAVRVTNIGSALLTYRLLDNVDQSTTTTPTSAVVIPTDATGPVNIILESSTDLVTWTTANPGAYGASTSRRFFRVRAVNQ